MRPAGAKSIALVLLLVLVAACADTTAGREEQSVDGGNYQAQNPGSCEGSPARSSRSESYRPGAPEIRQDGEDLELLLRVVSTLDGRCGPARGALVEIWHTGDSATYSPDKWRTALRTDQNGEVTYRTVRPTAAEGQSHFHVRGTIAGETFEWVIGVRDTDGMSIARTLVTTVTETPPAAPGTETNPSPGV